jgi:hypothetical protein
MAVARPEDIIPLPGSWSFWADTVVGAVPLGPVTATAFTASRVLSDFGKGSITVPAMMLSVPNDRLLNLWSWRLWAYFNGALIWAGVPTGIADTAGTTVTLTLLELTGYLTRRQYDVAGGHTYTQVEQTLIAADIARPLLDIGVGISVSAGPGFLRDRQYAYLEASSRGELLTNLSQVISGPEFRTEYSVTPGTGAPHAAVRIAYPRVGSATGLGLVVPGTGTDYSGQWDSDMLRTRTFAVGSLPDDEADPNAQQPVAVVDRPQADLPRLDAVDQWPDTILQSTLLERANTAAVQYPSAVADLTGSVTVAMPPLGSYGPGDDVAVQITDPLLPGGLFTSGRLTEMDIDAAAGTVALTCSLTLPPAKPRDTLTARLTAQDRLISGTFHRNPAQLNG